MINNTVRKLQVISVEPEIADISYISNRRAYNPDVEITVSYLNYLHEDVTIVDRMGLRYLIKSNPNIDHKGFVIRVKYRFTDICDSGLDKLMAQLNENSSRELLQFKETFRRQREANHYRGAEITLDYPTTLEQFKAYGGVFYHRHRDLVISTHGFAETPAHPNSESATDVEGFAEGMGVTTGRDMLLFKIEIIDNNEEIGDRYVNLFGQVKKIPAKKNPAKSDGVYINELINSHLNLKDTNLVQRFITIEEATKEMNLFSTFMDALNHGDIITTRKEELAKTEHEITRLKQEMQADKLIQDQKLVREQAELSERQAKLEREKKEFEFEYEKKRKEQNEEYERRANDRKETADLIKMLPMIVIATAAIIAAFAKTTKA